ncbi:MAG: hypothetical protein A3H35_14215 [Betaproteobacteria bacterium RIFCSPLOWO2_02_FULL_62_17]|nr:MAG: hypothetical protein A3H35_14215 [Betaproteobacteria bacterium RIFCSPLOWO2_02_FULL_62_17]
MNGPRIDRFVLVCLFAALPVGALAQAYPSKPIRSVLTVGAGGGGDAAARLIGQKLFEAMGQPVVIDPQGGAAGVEPE